jgi:hypothetical protein
MSRIPSVMSHAFNQIPSANIQRSKFKRSHGLKTTFDSGSLVPVYVDEVLPGDTFNLAMTGFGRLATPIYPVMDNLFLDTFFFFVPNRLVWDNWQKFNGEQENPGDSTDYLIPTLDISSDGTANQSIFDYMGLPTEVDLEGVNALPFRAYNLIYNEWFRDQNLIHSIEVPKGDGPDLEAIYQLKKRCKRHDYFTSCLPWPQKGDSVDLPLGTSAPITTLAPAGDDDHLGVLDSQSTPRKIGTQSSTVNDIVLKTATPDFLLEADLSEATAATINQLRQAFQIQRLYERDARGGTRYIEIIRSHFGVVSPDARLQRPEYLGGGSTAVNINPIAQTSETQGGGTPQGNLAAMGTLSFNNHGFQKSFTEHGYIIGLACVRADLTYQQGLDRMWSRQTRWDFYWPSLAHLGEQAVLSKEIFADGTENDESVFGYQERFAEYRYKPSRICGRFRSNYDQSLDAWHLSQYFETRPILNELFIEENPPVDRIIAVQTEPHFLLDAYFHLVCERPMPVYSVPGLIDHF